MVAFAKGQLEAAYLPYSITKLTCFSEIENRIRLHGTLTQITEASFTADMELFSYDGKPLVKIEGFHARMTDPKHLQQMLSNQTGLDVTSWFYQLCWQLKPLEKTEDLLPNTLLIVSYTNEKVEGLQAKTVKPDQAVQEIAESQASVVLWFVTGNDALKEVLSFVQAIGKLNQKPRLFFITRGIQPIGSINSLEVSPFNGFFKTLTLEMRSLDCRHIDLGKDEPFPLKELGALDQEVQVAYRQNVRYVPRLLPAKNAKRSGKDLLIPMTKAFILETTARGPLENLYLKGTENNPSPDPQDILIEVKAAGLNFRDVLFAMGFQVGPTIPLGGECAGIVKEVGPKVTVFKPGDRVFGMTTGCFASHAVGPAAYFIPMPEQLSYEEAAGLPVVFATAHYCLKDLAHIKAGDKVLIHAAAGGVGLAAIQIAKLVGAEIFATASPGKQDYLRALGIEHIYNSRNLDFAQEILRDTKNHGVDIVLNSLSGEGFIEKSLSACHSGARFIEIGKRNIWSKEAIKEARPDIDYFIFALDEMMIHQLEEVAKLLQDISREFHNKNYHPLQIECFPIAEAQTAFEYLQRAKNIGKVILTIPERTQLKIDPAGSYLITGGFGGLGQKVAEWLIGQGAKHIVLAGRKISQTGEFPTVKIEPIAIDISQKSEVISLMQKFGTEWPELKGIVHAAGLLDDGIIQSQNWSRFEKVFAPKIQGSWNLHEASLSKPLDFLILFSSLASIIGNPGQTNYAAANAYLDALAYYRREKGLPAVAINWGNWGEVGLVAHLIDRHRSTGFIALKPAEAMKAFELAIQQPYPQITIANVNWKVLSNPQALLNELAPSKPKEPQLPILLQRLSEALPLERKDILQEYLQRTTSKILGTTSLNPEIGFFEAGMDSLMAEELQERIQADIGTLHKFPTTLSFDYPSINKMTGYFEQHIFPLMGIKTEAKTIKKSVSTDLLVEEEIAIIGLGCRFPGGANSPSLFWDLLKEGYDGISEIPQERWDVNAHYDSDPEAPGKMYVRRGGFLNLPIESFDAQFFGISSREAEYMDPQQRLLLEVAWEALEDACINPHSLKGSETGVFMGLCSHDYFDLITKVNQSDLRNAYLASGNAASVLAGRLSYILGLQGPSMVLDTACSSSLVAISMACKSLQRGESQLALAGGVNVLLNKDLTIDFCKAHMLAKDGYCKAFDADADGYVRSEGCGVIVLKRLSDAIQNGDPILAVIRAADINQDGASSGLTVPNGESQAALIRKALKYANLEPKDIDYIEAHGTGTSLGDPIEVGALGDVFSGRTGQPLYLGTVKTNIGHLEAAAGIAGVIKTVLALNHEIIPPHLHFHQLNPRISLESIPAKIPIEITSWPHSNRSRIAGISSFGFSGTNAHVIIEEPPIREFAKNAVDRPMHLFTLSAKTEAALDQLIHLYQEEMPHEDLADIAFTANTGRAHFSDRIAVIAKTREELLNYLQTGKYQISHVASKPLKIIFIFTGKTSESTELMKTSSVFKEAMERSHGLFECAFAELLKSWGITPDYVAGEGRGDVIAAITAGIITLEEGLEKA